MKVGVKKYFLSLCLKYQMIDGKSIEALSHQLQKIAPKIMSEGKKLDQQFQIVFIIDILPNAWNDFKNLLRYNTKKFSLECMITRIRIEEEAKKQDLNDKVLVVSNNNTNNNFSSVVLNSSEKQFKNQNCLVNKNFNRNKNRNP